MKENLKKLGKIVKRSREDKGISQRELAEKIGVTRQMLSNWECGECEPKLINFYKAVEILDLSIDEVCRLAFAEDTEETKSKDFLQMEARMEARMKRLEKLVSEKLGMPLQPIC